MQPSYRREPGCRRWEGAEAREARSGRARAPTVHQDGHDTFSPVGCLVCVRCGQDWTADLEALAGSPGATLDAICDCGAVVSAEGSETGVFAIDGLIEEEDPPRGAASAGS